MAYRLKPAHANKRYPLDLPHPEKAPEDFVRRGVYVSQLDRLHRRGPNLYVLATSIFVHPLVIPDDHLEPAH